MTNIIMYFLYIYPIYNGIIVNIVKKIIFVCPLLELKVLYKKRTGCKSTFEFRGVDF